MPIGFLNCVKKGGYVATVQKGKGKYQRTCLLKGRLFKSSIKKKKQG